MFSKKMLLFFFSFNSLMQAQNLTEIQENFKKSKKTYNGPCQNLYGKALTNCMDGLKDQEFILQLYFLKDENKRREIFLKQYLDSPEAFEKFYKNFKTDEDWHFISKDFSPEEHQIFPNISTKIDHENDVFYRKLYRNGKYAAYGAAGVAALCSGGYGLYLLYNGIYSAGVAAGAAAETTKLIAAGKAAVAGMTCKKAAVGGTTVLISIAIKDKNTQKPQDQIPT